jgi:excisionase family DNA binding protein
VDMEHEWPRISELARAPRIAHNRTCELVGPGEMPSMRIGYSVRVGRSELDRWLEEQRQPNAR